MHWKRKEISHLLQQFKNKIVYCSEKVIKNSFLSFFLSFFLFVSFFLSFFLSFLLSNDHSLLIERENSRTNHNGHLLLSQYQDHFSILFLSSFFLLLLSFSLSSLSPNSFLFNSSLSSFFFSFFLLLLLFSVCSLSLFSFLLLLLQLLYSLYFCSH